ncbi:hypothetical protein, partial [Nocardia abscessus]|uniref:hypothetical protein n=1 Tax=Nocardia abscessus TaxID=120957 RepID=UPI002454CA2A
MLFAYQPEANAFMLLDGDPDHNYRSRFLFVFVARVSPDDRGNAERPLRANDAERSFAEIVRAITRCSRTGPG